jgi:hypothetical protein
MSRLLLAKAARVCGWDGCDEWPELLSAREVAKLQGDPDVEAIMPPQGAGLMPERPRYAVSRAGMYDPVTGARSVYRSSDAHRMVPAYDAAMVRGLLAGVELSPMLAAWLDTHAPQGAPALAEPQGKPSTIFKQSALIANIEPIMMEPSKLAGLLSNANKNGLNACRAPGGWNLGEVARWLLLKGHLKDEISEKYINTLIEQAVNNS